MKRRYFEDINYKPFLFYIVFGVSGDELEVSREKHHVDEFPHRLNMQFLCKDSDAEYMESFFEGAFGYVLEKNDPDLFAACKRAERCVVIRGEIEHDEALDYMRNVNGFIQAFIDQGACGVLDLITISLHSPEEWRRCYFEKDINAQRYVTILLSEEENGTYWLHTRGMLKFGRPDISISGISETEVEDKKQIIDQLIYYGGQGAIFRNTVKLHTQNGKSFVVNTEFINDFDNDDFNNAYYNVSVLE